ncbi:LrgB-like family-domain-containing protein [Diplogelasinospora grovesii]|uniref:LrgB-like family-domain-containing protein n=1 Tax=Diplogelasinospora grovesii TaxID=303347 RepID=A0AAN6N6P9_9PEZI|nr:LrgB-like family-domain-containing protein [Diplogelasinospora grovesii]
MALQSQVSHPVLTAATDFVLAIKQTFQTSGHSLLRSWLYAPFGIVVMLLACFGVDVLFKTVKISFPPSVACLILLFLGLLLCEALLGSNKTRRIVTVIDVPAGWSLRWINVFFTPTFVLLPLSPRIGVVEVMKIVAVFIVGFVVMFVLTAYMTRGLQLVSGTSKRAHTERAEELGSDTTRQTDIPLSVTPAETPSEPQSVATSTTALNTLAVEPPPSTFSARSQDATLTAATANEQSGGGGGGGGVPATNTMYRQTPLPRTPSRAHRWAGYISANLDWLTYATLLLSIGIPLYYVPGGYAMPLHLCITVLAYFTALTLPPAWRQYLHPVLVSAFLTVMTVWILGLTRGLPLQVTLTQYRTGLKYLQLWERTPLTKSGSGGLLPGAGDVFGSVLDASIVSLALPMYQYRRELRAHFAAIMLPNILLAIGSLFAYPAVCYAVGISAPRSLAFAARSLTLALATPAMDNLGGDANTVSALAIMSGIFGALLGGRMLKVLRIPEDDYVTRGVTLGANSSAIATALLLRTDPRAAALSSLSMSLFGTITVLFTAIPAIRDVVRAVVGL